MSSETFKLSILLDYKGDSATQGLTALVRYLQLTRQEFGKTNSAFIALQKTANKGFKFDSSNSGIKNLRKDLSGINSELDKIKKKGKGVFTDGATTPKFKTAKDELDGLSNKVEKHAGFVKRLAKINEDYLQPSRQIADAWRGEYDSLKIYTDEAKKLYLAQSRFRLINLSPEENTKAFEAVNKVVREMGTVTRTEGIETLTDLHTALGNLDHAIEALPMAAKYRFSMKTLFGDKFSDSEIESQIQKAFKFLEMTGKVAKGREEMERSFNAMTQITNATGGRITPDEMLLMARRGGTSIQNLTPEGMRTLSAPIQELGGSGAGTSMMSTYMALVGGVMKESSAAEFARLGLVDSSKIEYGKGQKIKKLLPGANKLGDAFMENPLQSADMLRDAMKSKGINTDDQKAVSKEIAVLFQNRAAQRLMSILMNQRGQVVKEAGLAAGAKDNDQTFDTIDKQLKDLQKVQIAWNDFKINAGIPLIQAFGKVAESATPILKFFGEHETLTQWTLYTIGAVKALKLFSETSSIVSNSGLNSFFSKTESEVEAVSQETTGLRKNFLSLKNIGQVMLLVAVAGDAWQKIQELRKVIDDWNVMNKGLDSSGQGQKKAYEQLPNDKRNPKDEARNALNLLQQGNNEFEKALGAKSQGWQEWLGRGLGSLVGKDTNYSLFQNRPTTTDLLKNQDYLARVKQIERLPMRQQTLGGLFPDAYSRVSAEIAGEKNIAKRVPILTDPNVMASFRRDIMPTLGLNNFQKEFTDKLLSSAFPISFAQSSKILGEDQSKLAHTTGTLAESFSLFNQPLSTANQNVGDLGSSASKAYPQLNAVSTSANSASNSLDSLSDKIAGWQPPTPQIQNPGVPNPTVSTIPSHAVGGIVEKDGVAMVHAGNVITPARTRGFGEVAAMVRGADARQRIHIDDAKSIISARSTQTATINYSPRVTINAASPQAKDDFQALLNEHAKHIARIVGDDMANRRVRA